MNFPIRSGVASPPIWSRYANFKSSLFISLEIDCFYSQWTRKYLHSGTKSAGWLYATAYSPKLRNVYRLYTLTWLSLYMTTRAYNLLEVFVEVMAYIGSIKSNIWTYPDILEFPDWLFVIYVNKNLNFAYCIAFAFYIHRLFVEHARRWSQYYST
jgi:hypothetical protein